MSREDATKEDSIASNNGEVKSPQQSPDALRCSAIAALPKIFDSGL